jgi:hypothetical protein
VLRFHTLLRLSAQQSGSWSALDRLALSGHQTSARRRMFLSMARE